MVIGKDQTIGAYHNARAIVAEIDYAVLEAGVRGAVELIGCELQAEALHRFGSLIIDFVQHPHAFVGITEK